MTIRVKDVGFTSIFGHSSILIQNAQICQIIRLSFGHFDSINPWQLSGAQENNALVENCIV